MELEYKLSEETAKEQFDLLISYYSIEETDMFGMFARIQRKLLKAIRLGKLEITIGNEGIAVIQTLEDNKKIMYKEVDGLASTVVSKIVNGNDKVLQMLACSSKEPVSRFHKLSGLDLITAELLGTCFLAAYL